MPQPKPFLLKTLPWVLAAAGLALYVATLGRWLTVYSLFPFARVSGIYSQPVLTDPLYFLLTLPLKLLPTTWLPAALHLFSALCGAGTLALLARSVALLPHDRTPPQRVAEPNEAGLLTIRAAWLPIVLAVLVVGLQQTFWERAAGGGPEMLDLLLFAYVVRCLLEYRLTGREAWLLKAAFVYALGMTESWLLVLLLPAFGVALVWLMGFAFFSARFLLRAWLAACAGLSLYLLLPLVATLHPDAPVSFWPALKFILVGQKNQLAAHWKYAREDLTLAALPSLLPMFVLALKFKVNYGDTSRLGSGLATITFHVLHAAFLICCAWLALDPPFSPASLGLGAEFLPAYYLAALGVGYCSGYFLLLFGERAKASGRHREMIERLNRTVVAGVWLWAGLTVVALAYRNAPVVRTADGRQLLEYATWLTSRLPAKPAVLLSDDPYRLWMVQAVLAARADSPKHLPVSTRPLPLPDYHRVLHRQSDGAWPLPPTNQVREIAHLTLIERMLQQAAKGEVYYLHPSFGYYFEYFHAEPHGPVHRLIPYGTNDVLPPPLSAAVLDENQKFWTQTAAPTLARLEARLKPNPATSNRLSRALAAARVSPAPSTETRILGTFVSRGLNTWGVRLQRLGRLEEAGQVFAQARALNPLNVVAEVNRQFNENLRAGSKARVNLTRTIEDQFGAYRNWDQVIGENGFFDEPTFTYEQGRVFAGAALFRQAITEFERVRVLVPDDLPTRLWLGSLYTTTRLYDRALDVVREVRQQTGTFALTETNRTDLLAIETGALFGLGRADEADRLLQDALRSNPTNYYLLAVCAQVYMRNGQYAPALALFEQQLRLRPRDTDAMMNKGYVCLQLGDFERAIPTLDQLLALQTNNHPALVNRAIANLQAGHLDAAERDYRRLLELYPNAYQVHYGLGEIAWRRHDTNAAIRFYQLYCSNAPPHTTEARAVVARLQQLKAASP